MNNEWSKEWIKEIKIGTTGFEPYPLQFANVERIEKNDAVYILDETGSGKTISSGLMALHYLYNNPDKDVLILTVPTLKRSGQFINDWFSKLPFREINLQSRITVENNVFSNIAKHKKQNDDKWGLIVIDEAHGYLEADKRKEAVKKLKSDKVIFMTATPIKRGEYNLEDYIKLAQEILVKEVDSSWPDKLPDKLIPNKKGLSICASFDESLPVTRYFKDTVKALEYVEDDGVIDFEKTKAVRKIPVIWDYEPGKKIQRLVDEIKRIRRTEDADNADNTDNTAPSMRSRFIVFTKLIKKEQEKIEEYLQNDDRFTQYTGEQSDKLTYRCVNGNSESQIEEFSSNGDGKVLPDVLIITYQIAEAGVNLPGYNYVINYHVPRFPSAIEQRFGRIDRMGKSNGTRYDEINMVFLLSDRYFDTNKMNYYQAISIYLNELLTKLPSKNSLLSKEILDFFFDDIKNIKTRQDEIKKYENQLGAILKIADDLSAGQNGSETFDPQSIDEPERKILEEFYTENDMTLFEDGAENAQRVKTVSSIIDEIRDRIEDLKRNLCELSGMNIDDYGGYEGYKAFLDNIKDKIFYYSSDRLQTLYAIKKEKKDKIGENNEVGEKVERIEKGCAELIFESESYTKYVGYFNANIRDLVKLTEIYDKKSEKLKTKYSEYLEEYFEKRFIARGGRGDFDLIFMLPEEYEALFKNEIFPEGLIDNEDRRILCKYAHNVITRLPFFKMVDRFKESIGFLRIGVNGKQLDRFDFHLPKEALKSIEKTIPDGLKKVIGETDKRELFVSFNPYYDRDKGEWINAECSNWLKLFYICAVPASMKFYELTKKCRLFSERSQAAWIEYNEDYLSAEKEAYDGEEYDEQAARIRDDILKNTGIPVYDSYEDMVSDQFVKEKKEIGTLIQQVFMSRDEYFIDLFLGTRSVTKKFNWRKVYLAYEDVVWSKLLSRMKCGGGYTNDWLYGVEFEFWTYLFFSYLDIWDRIDYDTNFCNWMQENFLPRRCLSGITTGRDIIKEIFDNTIKEIKKQLKHDEHV